MARARSGPRERSSRLDRTLRRPAGLASRSSSRSGLAARLPRARRGAAGLLAGAFALLLSAGAAEAQSSVKLVGNTGQATHSSTSFQNDMGQAFTTGPNATGYKLTAVDLDIHDPGGTPPGYRVRIMSDASNNPGAAILGTLTSPTSLNSGSNRFTAAGGGIDLDPETQYWVVLDALSANSSSFGWRVTSSIAEDAGAAAGWRFDAARVRAAAATAWAGADRPYKMALRGYAKTTLSTWSSTALVSNGGQAANTDSGISLGSIQVVPGFRTGANPQGYALDAVEVDFFTAPNSSVSVQVGTGVSIGGSGFTAVATLTRPASLGAGVRRFTAPAGTVLEPDTWYYVHVTGGGSGASLRSTDSNAEDAGAATGWTIADSVYWRTAGGWNYNPGQAAARIAVHGHAVSGPPGVLTPTVSKDDGTELTVRWTASTSFAATDYDVRYRRKGDTAWTNHPHDGTATTATISGVLQGASWEAQVRATNAVGTGPWSAIGAGHTGPARLVRAEATANGRGLSFFFTKVLSHAGASSRYTVVADGSNVAPSTASWDWGDGRETRLVLMGTIQAGQAVTVSYTTAGSGVKLFDIDSLDVASFGPVTVTNLVASAPAKPASPSVSAVAGTKDLTVSWTAPADNNGAITDYDVRYFKGTTDPVGDGPWIEAGETGGHDHAGTETTATLTGLDASSTYRVQVRAKNSAGTGAWSDSGSGTAGVAVPAAPATPTVSTVSGTRNLRVAWVAPDNGGSTITDYDLRYYEGAADPEDEADWVTENESSGLPDTFTDFTATTHDITGLKAGTAYRVQVRAANAAGEGPWSASRAATTNTASGTNNAPFVATLRTGGGTLTCIPLSGTEPVWDTVAAPSGAVVTASPILDNGGSRCGPGPNRVAPMLFDRNGDALTVTAEIRDLPDNVVVGDNIPSVSVTGGQDLVGFEAWAAFGQTNVEVHVTATDPHGASGTGRVIFQVGPAASDTNGAPRFSGTAADRQFAPNEAITPFTLPAATGGDLGSFPRYLYAVHGLPAGLEFDPVTRRVSGTPTARGPFTVAYTAEDADAVRTDADTARQTFEIRVGSGPKIHRVRIVSHPTYDSDCDTPSGCDGVADTYGKGDKILIDVEFGSEAPTKNAAGNAVHGRDVPVVLDGNVRMRLDLGDDDNDLTNSRRVLSNPELLHGGETLRFAYEVVPHDRDTTDGVWVQTGSGDRILLLVGAATLKHAVTGERVGVTMPGLRTAGNPGHKVDGSKVTADIGPRPVSATVNGKTLEVTFNKALATLSAADKEELRFNLHVEGAGEVYGFNGAQHPAEVSASGSTLTLTLNEGSKAQVSDTVTLTYAGSELKDTDSPPKRAPMFRDLAVTNNTGTENIPAPERAEVRAAGTQLRVHFNKALNASSLPAGSAFRLTVRDGDDDYRYIAGTGTAALGGGSTFVNVTLARAVRPDERAILRYTKPGTNPLQSTETGNPAVLSFYSFPVAWITDDTAPALAGGTVVQTGTSASKMALHFNEDLDAASEPAAGDFAVTTGATAVAVSEVAVAGRSVVLSLASAASEGTAFTVSYTPGANPIQDKAGNAAAAFRQTLNASATGQPALSSAVVYGHRVTLTWDKPLDPESAPAAGQFTLYHPAGVAGGGTTYNIRVASVAVAGRTVVLSLDEPVYPCAGASPFTVSYAVPTESPLQGLDGTDTAAVPAMSGDDPMAVRNDRGGWCGLGWFANARNGSVIIRAKRPFDTSVALQASWFAVTASGGPVTVTGAAFSADDPHELTLSLDREFEPDETVTVSYTRPPGESGLWDVTGKQLADLSEATVTIAAALPARLESAATEPQGRGLVLTFTQDIAHSSAHGSYTVTVDGERRATVRVFWQDDTVGLVLAEPVRWGQVVTVAYDRPASGVMLYGAGGLAVESFGPVTVSNAVARSANSPATGAPAIGGTARVGETLTATTANIADPDGLASPGYAFQWLLSGGGADAEIAGATASTYTLTAAEEGRTVRVRVTFTDDAGNAEALVSAATVAVLPPLPPLTAEFVGLPAEHNGKRLFTFELRFSENFPGRFDYRILRDHAFQVTEGRVRKAQRAAPGQNRRWTISVRPSSWKDVTITLPATTDCAAAGAICTPDGRMLSQTVTATVRGPVTLSVADAEAHEGEDEAIGFVVSLGRAASQTVTVDYATADGTAVAGEDYTATRGTLSFAEGELEKTVSVPILDDVLDEGSETFVLRLRNAQGAAIADGEATGTITNADPLQKMWLSRFGRTVAGHVTEAVSDRLASPLSGAQVTVGGQTLDLAATGDEAWLGRTLTSVAQALGAPVGPPPPRAGPPPAPPHWGAGGGPPGGGPGEGARG
ncbi:MAG: hypothetical protein F4X99_15350, partial [Gammaproteobacteria bacterium]|nr:hypothetical protein [Gammaproteobacteria bacterium]